jgi:predicted RNase H-like HicB family nuclease
MVTVPKVPDAITWGRTLSSAKRMAKEAIETSIEGEILIAAEKEGLVSLRKQHAYA